MHENSQQIIITAIFLLSIASIGGILTKYLKIPYASILVIIGFIVGILHIFPSLKITPSLIYYVFLPIIIFEGAVNIKLRPLISNALPISILSVLGTIISTIFTGVVIHFVLSFPLKQSLIFGAIVAPTDPVSILALLKNRMIKKTDIKSKDVDTGNDAGFPGGIDGKSQNVAVDGKEDIETLLAGESMFNDGISLVLFELFLALNFSGSASVFLHGGIIHIFQYVFGIIGESTLRFLYSSIGGSILGALLGYLASFILSIITDYSTEIMISLLLAYASLMLAYYVDVSFIMAIIFSGIVLANYGFKRKVSDRTLQVFPIVIEYLTFIINSLLFLIIGIEINLFKIFDLWIISWFIIVLVVFSRFIAVYSISPVINKIRNKFKIFSHSLILNESYKKFLVFGGLKGALPIAMALSLPLNLYMRYKIITYVFIVVLFSLTIQAIFFDIFARRYFKSK